MKKLSTLLLPLILVISGCAPAENQGNGQGDYEGTKKMVIDILKTDDGKKAIEEIITDEKTKAKLVMDDTTVKETIKGSLTSKEAEDFWKKTFEDPKFAETFAKSMQKEHEKLIKDLMKDPDYQKMMIDILKDPEMEKQFTDALKSQKIREEMKTVMIETVESPLFKAKMQDLLIKGAEELQKQGGQQGGEKKEGEGEGEGGGEGQDGGQS
ncbi:spore germination lipoprotein GerD [Calidifontibacillus oryziterrae]|uniref:spore germination lipoprotein GerD n=1 Tax=Calidifontibacillus oryziterrae TaxID=1191699 RepID=UPI00031C4D1E|nr:spore germination lipoprotein GerD [Calidifontibacillus oryziterrae]